MRKRSKAVVLEIIEKDSRCIYFRIQAQVLGLRQMINLHTQDGPEMKIGRWTIRISSTPEMSNSGKVFYLRGSDRNDDLKVMSCPPSLWPEFLGVIEKFNKIIGPIHTFEDHFFAKVPEIVPTD